MYENVNIGELFHEQVSVFLPSFMKTLYEIANITKKFPDSNYFASSQKFQFMKIFSDLGVEIKNNERTELEFVHDKVRYNFKVVATIKIFNQLSKQTITKIAALYPFLCLI